MTTHRLLPPVGRARRQISAHGRLYSPADVVDAPAHDAVVLEANGWTLIGPVGTTADRPARPAQGDRFVDTTLDALVTFDGATWRDLDGAAV